MRDRPCLECGDLEWRVPPQPAFIPVGVLVPPCHLCGGPREPNDFFEMTDPQGNPRRVGRLCYSCRQPTPGTLGAAMVPFLTALIPPDSFAGDLKTLRRLACQKFGRPEFDKEMWEELMNWLVDSGYARKQTLRNKRTGFVWPRSAREMALRLPIVKVLAFLEQEIRADGWIPVAPAPAPDSLPIPPALDPASDAEPVPLDEAESWEPIPLDEAEDGTIAAQAAFDREIASYYDESQRSVQDLEAERQSDPIPEPSEVTVGVLARLVWEIEKLHEAAGSSREAWDGRYTPTIRRPILRRQQVLYQAPGFRQFRTYLNAELGMDVVPEAIQEIERRLARRLRKTFEDVRQLTLVEAVAILNRPEAPADGSTTAGAMKVEPRPESGELKTSKTKPKPLNQPPQEAFLAYTRHVDSGWDQGKVGREMSKELGRTISQGQVSRWVKAVREWRVAGNEWPEGMYTSRMIPTDPSKLDKGPRGQNNARRKPAT